MKIIVIGDSLASSRSDDGIEEELRWPGLLSSSLAKADLINLSKGYSTTKRLNELTGLNADMLIVQLGIVDCAPRLLSKVESSIISRMPLYIRDKIIHCLKGFREQSSSRAYVKINKFQANLEELATIGSFGTIFVLGILPAGRKFIAKNPSVVEQINLYNDVIRNVCEKQSIMKFINPLDSNQVDFYTLDDGYHLNKAGHAMFFKSILAEMKFISLV